MSRKWSDTELATLRKHYHAMPTKQLAGMIGRTKPSIIGQAFREGLAKPFEPAKPKPDKFGFRAIMVSPRAGIHIKQIVAMLNARRIQCNVFCTDVGISPFTFYSWRKGNISPRSFDLEACFNYLGYTIPEAIPIKEKDNEG